MQAKVGMDEFGDFFEFYEPVQDAQIIEYLTLREKTGYKSPLVKNIWQRKLVSNVSPIAPNMTIPEFLPSQCLKFLQVLFKYFPRHKLCLSDFHVLPDTIEGVDAPVVQTRYQGSMIPCSTYLVQPGWFDIFFPTNFELMQQMYTLLSNGKKTQVLTQKEFLTLYSRQISHTRTQSGDNPMLTFYENMKFFLT
jgi:hypothetical protein